jgi:hypothetical protein
MRPLASFALAGWIAGLVATFGLAWLWQIIFPAIIHPQHYYDFAPSLLTVILIGLVVATPAALIGGVLGSRVPREGGRTEQIIMAAILGAILALPFSCYILWVFTGY